ncbi:MAG: hypothetical protein IPF50_05085 [Proteobacteria bacterium]|nr:hypothetical protein [Pseudomonadota bacterium]
MHALPLSPTSCRPHPKNGRSRSSVLALVACAWPSGCWHKASGALPSSRRAPRWTARAEPAAARLPGIERFAGKVFHSARRDHGHDLAGKRIASIGTGGSATQYCPRIAPASSAPVLDQRVAGLACDSSRGRGLAGLDGSVTVVSTIYRGEKTVAQDGNAQGVRNAIDDGYCLDGNRLRLVGGIYGAAGSEYRTEIQTYSRLVAVGTAGNGPQSFKVDGRDGLRYYCGCTSDSRIESVGQSTRSRMPMD